MDMDRQTITAIALAIGAMLFVAGLVFGPSGRSDGVRPAYAVDDVRYKFQRAEAKEKSKRKKPDQAVKEQFVTSGATSSGGGASEDSGSSENEEPSEDSSAEEPEAEEPPID